MVAHVVFFNASNGVVHGETAQPAGVLQRIAPAWGLGRGYDGQDDVRRSLLVDKD